MSCTIVTAEPGASETVAISGPMIAPPMTKGAAARPGSSSAPVETIRRGPRIRGKSALSYADSGGAVWRGV